MKIKQPQNFNTSDPESAKNFKIPIGVQPFDVEQPRNVMFLSRSAHGERPALSLGSTTLTSIRTCYKQLPFLQGMQLQFE